MGIKLHPVRFAIGNSFGFQGGMRLKLFALKGVLVISCKI